MCLVVEGRDLASCNATRLTLGAKLAERMQRDTLPLRIAASRSLRASFVGMFGPPGAFLPSAVGGAGGGAAAGGGAWPPGREGEGT